MKVKLTGSQKSQIRELKNRIRREKKYVPRGQGDGINQHLKLSSLSREIDRVKNDSTYFSNQIW